mgnify:CR=1 FL=1
MRLFEQTPEDYYNAPYAEFPALIRGTVFVVMAILWAFSKLMWRWKVEDADLLFERQEGRGSVVICNHTSMAELLAVETALFFGGRRIRPIFKSEFAKSKIVRWAFSRVGGIPVERGTADMKCLRAAQHALQRGEDVLIFPEGTRIRSREIKPEVHGGFALIAQMGPSTRSPSVAGPTLRPRAKSSCVPRSAGFVPARLSRFPMRRPGLSARSAWNGLSPKP